MRFRFDHLHLDHWWILYIALLSAKLLLCILSPFSVAKALSEGRPSTKGLQGPFFASFLAFRSSFSSFEFIFPFCFRVLFSFHPFMIRASFSQDSRSKNPTDESPSDPKVEASFLVGPNVELLWEQYRIPELYQLFAPDSDGWVNFLPLSQVAFYVEDLRTDLRFLISEFIRNLLDYYSLCPAQLLPNLVRLIISFALLCRLISIESRPSLFQTFFILRPHPKVKSWWFFNPKKGIFFITDLPSSIHGWKNRFFFISSSLSWGFPSCWDDPRTGPNENSQVEVDNWENFY